MRHTTSFFKLSMKGKFLSNKKLEFKSLLINSKRLISSDKSTKSLEVCKIESCSKLDYTVWREKLQKRMDFLEKLDEENYANNYLLEIIQHNNIEKLMEDCGSNKYCMTASPIIKIFDKILPISKNRIISIYPNMPDWSDWINYYNDSPVSEKQIELSLYISEFFIRNYNYIKNDYHLVLAIVQNCPHFSQKMVDLILKNDIDLMCKNSSINNTSYELYIDGYMLRNMMYNIDTIKCADLLMLLTEKLENECFDVLFEIVIDLISFTNQHPKFNVDLSKILIQKINREKTWKFMEFMTIDKWKFLFTNGSVSNTWATMTLYHLEELIENPAFNCLFDVLFMYSDCNFRLSFIDQLYEIYINSDGPKKLTIQKYLESIKSYSSLISKIGIQHHNKYIKMISG